MCIRDRILIDDTYNANPSSFKSVLENLNKMFPERRKIVVCGAMAELGESSSESHRQVANTMLNCGVEMMYGLGGQEIEFYLEGWKNAGGEKKVARHFIKFNLSFKKKIPIKRAKTILVSRNAVTSAIGA